MESSFELLRLARFATHCCFLMIINISPFRNIISSIAISIDIFFTINISIKIFTDDIDERIPFFYLFVLFN